MAYGHTHRADALLGPGLVRSSRLLCVVLSKARVKLFDNQLPPLKDWLERGLALGLAIKGLEHKTRGGVIGVRCFQVTNHTPHESPTPPRAPQAPGQGTRTSSFF